MTETETLTTRKPVEIRSVGGKSRSIGGYAAVFNSQSENLGGFAERVAPQFFNDSQAAGWPSVTCRYNHDDSYLLGATRSQTLRLSIDRNGLQYVVDLPESRADIYELVSRGDVANSSFAFVVDEDAWSLTERSLPLRTLVSGKLIDVAPVSSPAYSDTSVGLRSLASYKDVPIEDVMALSAQDALRKLFIRTDRPSPRETVVATRSLSGATAKLQTSAKSKPALSGVAAKMRTLAKKHGRVSA